MVVLALALGLAAAQAGSFDVTTATAIGKVTGHVLAPSIRDPFSSGIEFRDESGRLLLSKRITLGGPYAISLWQPEVEGLPQGSFVAVSAWGAADRIVFEPFLLGAVKGTFQQLLPALPELAHTDAACLYPAIRDRPLLLTIIKATAGKCVICWPKEYGVIRYHYESGTFRERWRFTSSRAFEDPGQVLKHYGVPCTTDLVSAANDHVVTQGPPQ